MKNSLLPLYFNRFSQFIIIMIPELSVQLYSIRNEGAFENTVRSLAEMGFTCVETAGFPSTTIEKAARLFKDLGLKVPSGHVPLPLGDKKNEVIENALLLEQEYLITGGPPEAKKNFDSFDNIKYVADLYQEASLNLEPYGLSLGYHNHDWDLEKIGDQWRYQFFLEHAPQNLIWEVDLFWVQKVGLNPVDFIHEMGDRGKIFHFKDGILNFEGPTQKVKTQQALVDVVPGKPFLPAGTGDVDLKAASKAAIYAKYIVVELDSFVGDMMEAIHESYLYFTTNGIARGGK